MEKKTVLQAIKFALFSASAGIIQVASCTLFLEVLDWEYWLAYLVSLILSILWNFTLNRKFTFKSSSNIPIAMAKVFGYYLVFTPLSTWLGHIAENSGVNEYIVLGVTMLSNLVTEYLFCKYVVYRNENLENKDNL